MQFGFGRLLSGADSDQTHKPRRRAGNSGERSQVAVFCHPTTTTAFATFEIDLRVVNPAMLHQAAQAFWYPGAMQPPPPPDYVFAVPVREVWASNLDAEMNVLRGFADRAIYVAFAVHYPGVVYGGGGAGAAQADHNTLTAEQRYATIKANVDALKPLQIGVAVCTDDGRRLAWEFNLSGFDLATDPHAAGSVDYLVQRGMNFDDLRACGIPMARLTNALVYWSGLLQRPGLSWIAYAGAYHPAYLLKVIEGGQPLPGDVAGFLAVMRWVLGGVFYDVARMAGDCPYMPVGLERLASTLGIAPPLGRPGLAGGSAVLALETFLSLNPGIFGEDVNMYGGLLHGLQVT